MSYFKKHISNLFEMHIDAFEKDIPRDFLLNHLSCTVAEAVKWWVSRDFNESPEELGKYIMKLQKAPMPSPASVLFLKHYIYL